jgi:hypothetical protein
VLASDVHLFAVEATVQRIVRQFGANDYLFGQRNFQTPNEPNAMVIQYYLKSAAPTDATITIADSKGQEAARLTGPAKAGINSALWTMRDRGEGTGPGGGGGGRQNAPGVDVLAQWAPLGDYTVTLQAAGKTLTQKAQITKMQGWSIGATPQVIKSLPPAPQKTDQR